MQRVYEESQSRGRVLVGNVAASESSFKEKKLRDSAEMRHSARLQQPLSQTLTSLPHGLWRYEQEERHRPPQRLHKYSMSLFMTRTQRAALQTTAHVTLNMFCSSVQIHFDALINALTLSHFRLFQLLTLTQLIRNYNQQRRETCVTNKNLHIHSPLSSYPLIRGNKR